MNDSFNRKINYLRVSLTDRCNLRCIYCMDDDGINQIEHQEILSLEEMYLVIHKFVEKGVTKLRLTGGEPLVRKGFINFLYSVSKIKGLEDIAITTNGILLKDNVVNLKKAGLKRVNISLDTLNPSKYKLITKYGNLFDVLDAIDQCIENNIKVKINVVLMKDINDDEIMEFINLANTKKIDVRFIELMPISDKSDFAKKHFISYLDILKKFNLTELKTDDIHSPAKYYRYKDYNGKIGFITALSNHFCDNCNRMRLTADGKLKPCLLNELEIDLKEALRDGKNIDNIIENAISNKPKHHFLSENYTTSRTMNKIGG